MNSSSKIAPDPAGAQLGLFWLTPGISRANGAMLLFSGFCLIGIYTFNSFVQPYLLQEVLAIPKERQGTLIGTLNLLQEIVVILLVSFIGASSDKLGRRMVYVIGVLLLAAGFIVYPLATTEAQLYGVRIFYALGFAGASVMFHVCVAEYSQDATRGRWIGTVGVLNGLGVVIMALALSRMPSWYIAAGFDSVQAIRLSYWTFAAYLIVLAVILRFGLAAQTSHANRHDSTLTVAMRGVAAARGNPRVVLAYFMAFASRGDLVILTNFIALWLVQEGSAAGLSAAEATAKAGMFFGLSQAAGLLWSYPIGIILDRLERMTAMCVAFGLAALGYFALGQVSDPFGAFMIVACVLAGMGESSAMISAGVLIGQEAPAEARGAVLGTFSLCGACGIMLLTFAGGVVFDRFGPTAPFIMMAVINFAVLAGALALRSRTGAQFLRQRG